MDCVIGFTGKDFTLIGADQNAGRSIMVFQQDLDKIMHLDSHKLLGVAGDPADTVFEPQYLQKNVELYRLRNGVKLSTHATANYIRGEKAANLRDEDAVKANIQTWTCEAPTTSRRGLARNAATEASFVAAGHVAKQVALLAAGSAEASDLETNTAPEYLAELVAVAAVPRVTGRWSALMNFMLRLPNDALAVLPCRLRVWDAAEPGVLEESQGNKEEADILRRLDSRFEYRARVADPLPISPSQTRLALGTFGAATFVEESHQLYA